MRILLTFGPSHEPIDGARRLTNMSTGRLGVRLANAFLEAGWEVHCLRGEGSTFNGALQAHEVESFTTNDDLTARMERISRLRRIDAVLHAAALCDFRVARALDAGGDPLRSKKISTRDGRVLLELEPAVKVLPKLRGWFPDARIVGWKYELAGTRDDAFACAWRQLAECGSDACVLNGAAYGTGFAVCHSDRRVEESDDAGGLARTLLGWLDPGRNPCRSSAVPVAIRRPRLRQDAARRVGCRERDWTLAHSELVG